MASLNGISAQGRLTGIFAAVLANAEENEMTGDELEVVVALDRGKERADIFITNGDDLPALLTYKVMMPAIGEDLVDCRSGAHVGYRDLAVLREPIQGAINCGLVDSRELCADSLIDLQRGEMGVFR